MLNRDDLVLEISKWLRSLNAYQDNFLTLGYQLPDIYMARVDSIRQRSNDERSIKLYCNERIMEMLHLQAKESGIIWWSPESRKALRDTQRSPYLDSLQKLADDGGFDFLGKDTSLLDVILDPNLILYSRWKLYESFVPEMSWRDHLEDIENQKIVEARKLEQRLANLMPNGGKCNYSDLLKLSQAIAAEKGFKCVVFEKGSKPRVVIEANLSDKISIYLEWEDYFLLRTRGNVELRFVIREANAKVWDRNDKTPFFCINLGSLVPGSESYLNTHGDWYLVALSLFAHMDFMYVGAVGHLQLPPKPSLAF